MSHPIFVLKRRTVSGVLPENVNGGDTAAIGHWSPASSLWTVGAGISLWFKTKNNLRVDLHKKELDLRRSGGDEVKGCP